MKKHKEQFVKFEDVAQQTTENYFQGNQFSIDVFNKKYRVNDSETYVKAIKRVCDFIASVEDTEEKKKYWSERWFNEIYHDIWHPAGSIMQGAGSKKKISLSNCTTISLGNINESEEWDNLESIIKNTAYEVAKTAAYRQGLGIDFSRLRPKGTIVANSSKESQGCIHWMKFIDSLGYYIGQKGRIPAMLFSLNISHPDIIDFINVKSNYNTIQNANISIQMTNDFYRAVENNEMFTLKFEIPACKKGDKIYIDSESSTKSTKCENGKYYYLATHDREGEKIEKQIPAKELFELICKNMYNFAEPGIQNIDIMRKYSNSDYVYDPNHEYDSRIMSTNACSEQALSRSGLCVLSSINCEKFSIKEEEYKNELLLIGESVNRFLDNVVECELKYQTYATEMQKIGMKALRRTGAGYTNLAGWLFKCNTPYGSPEGNKAAANFTKYFNYSLYKSSIKIGEEKGNFGLFTREKYIQSPFIQRMMSDFPDLQFNTMRNSNCSSIAPSGSLSTQFSKTLFSYGIEPGFGMYYWKRTRISGKYEYYFIVPHIVREVFKQAGLELPIKHETIKDTWDGKIGLPVAKFIEENKDKLGIKFKSSTEITVNEKLDLMAQVAKYIDSAISVTYMLPEKLDYKVIQDFVMDVYRKELKSVTVFQDKKLYGIISFIPFRDLAFKLKNEGMDIHPQNFIDEELKELGISKDNIVINNNAPKRLKTLPSDMYVISVKNEKFLIAVGIQNGVPYEVIGGNLNGFGFKKSHFQGNITKEGHGKYTLEVDGVIFEDFAQHFTPTQQVLFRSISLSLRHGVPIQYIVEQIQKGSDDMFCLSHAISRVLKKYIKNGQKISGRECPQCKATNLVYIDGCVTCSCGWGKCG